MCVCVFVVGHGFTEVAKENRHGKNRPQQTAMREDHSNTWKVEEWTNRYTAVSLS